MKNEISHSEIKYEERVNHPVHYSWLKDAIGVEPNEILRLFNYNKGAALKYIIRSGRKHEEGYSEVEKEIQDLEKAIFYLQDEIKFLKK